MENYREQRLRGLASVSVISLIPIVNRKSECSPSVAGVEWDGHCCPFTVAVCLPVKSEWFCMQQLGVPTVFRTQLRWQQKLEGRLCLHCARAAPESYFLKESGMSYVAQDRP